MRNLGITLLSLALTSAVIGNAYYQKKQFYPSVVYITKSNPSMAVMYIQAFIFVFLMGKLVGKIFFGELRAAELEHLMEKAWYAMTETCLAFTVFRDDFSPKFVALFTILLFLKSFHWLAEDRVDFMERSPIISVLFHIRVVSLLTVLGLLDLYLVNHAYLTTVTKGASVQLVFGFEYAILLTIVVNIGIKYVLHTIDINSEIPWENKAVFLLYTELVMGFFKVILYVMFMVIMLRISTLPLFAFRPMYYTLRSFKRAFNDVILSRRAIRNMNTLYPDATTEELAAADNVCIICREEMISGNASKKLPCNHIFHTSCLRSWFQRQQTCPTCRLNILQTPTLPAAANRDQAAQPNQRPPNLEQRPMPPFNFPWAPIIPPQLGQQMGPPGGVPPTSGQTANPAQPGQSADQPQPQRPEGGSGMPFFYPPFPFIPYHVPPPIPPPDFSGLSNEELRVMENSAREGVEARLKCLRQIQSLLDASVILMQQYSASASVAAAQEVEASRTRAQTTTVPEPPEAQPTDSSTLQKETSKEVKPDDPKPSTSRSPENTKTITPEEPIPSTSSGKYAPEEEIQHNIIKSSQLPPDLEKARRRRLEKFANTSLD